MKTTSNPLWAVMILCVTSLGLAGPVWAGHHAKDEMKTENIVSTAAAAGQFDTLLAAAKAAGLADVLANDGPFTVFAPTDEAFAALPAGTVENLLQPENKGALARILKFHVLSGKVKAKSLADGIRVDTLAGVSAQINATEGGFAIEGADIVATDIKASNGIIHVIDRVILPPEQMSSAQPRLPAVALIDSAIDKGVPMFNHGNAAATTAVYMTAAEALLSFADEAQLSPMSRDRLTQGVRRASMQSNARQQAWTLRYALDDVRADLMQPATQVAMQR